MIKAILLMGGSGRRFGSPLPKQFHALSGKPIYLHTLEALLSSALFDEILLIAPEEHLEQIRTDLTPYNSHPIRLIPGGATRQESSYHGLLACGPETRYILIHDAVRPFVTPQILHANLDAARAHGAVDTCIPSADTLVHSPDHNTIHSIPTRAHYLRGQTPQTFSYPLILNAHQKTKKNDATDDCALILEQGHPVHIVPGADTNIKITTESDLTLAEQLIRTQKTRPQTPHISLQGKTIALTGGTGGIGSALASALKEEGAHPISLARTGADYNVDLTDPNAARATFQAIRDDHGPLFALINCIGHLSLKPFSKLTQQEIDTLIHANFTSVITACHVSHIAPGGHIINFASSSYTRGRKGYCLYSATKAAIVNFTQGLALEHPELHINAIAPQRTRTPMRTAHFPTEDPSTLLDPKKIARETLHLLKTKGITGSTIEIKRPYTLPELETLTESSQKHPLS